MAFFSRFVHPASERELLRALYTVPCPPRRTTFSPNFDVRETESAYILEGELPGFHDKSKLDIEFTDPQTLFIKGRLEKSRSVTEAESHQESHKARAEDASDEQEENRKPEIGGKSIDTEAKKEPKPKLWVSERTSGEFQRSFTFPINIDQEGVKASLEHGLLKVIVPKRSQPVGRKIEIQ